MFQELNLFSQVRNWEQRDRHPHGPAPHGGSFCAERDKKPHQHSGSQKDLVHKTGYNRANPQKWAAD